MKPSVFKKTGKCVSLLAGALVLILAGCGAETRDGAMDINQQGLNRDHGYQNMQPNAMNNTPNRNNANTGHRFDANTTMEMSQKIADGVAAMDEVETAHVMLAGNNAYVAVMLHHGAGITNEPNGNGSTGAHTDSNMGQTNNNAATNSANANTNNGTNWTIEEITPEIKQKIAAKVKELDGNIQDVFVSANPDFMERMKVYADEFGKGRPLTGFVEELGAMIERVFPANAANDRPLMTP
ncbi:YhcN/YlaJ family sporulation lipoprotein [Paenibacillus senegalensis]|uniref:YhcN/YlaJ family sporulation lipoprotein n=1 Tax=Paenibacillus senegalensis TaxID=1465766 RepID=UPI000288AD5B|nr:YhcN/YlaJ family sporulation lipoprotein [Paenibacillus senegalensis]